MDTDVEYRIVQLLRDAHSPTVSLRALHGQLVAEAGPAVGSYARFADEIRRSQRLMVFEAQNILGEVAIWPAGLRSEYEAQLSAMGLDSSPLVTLLRSRPDSDLDLDISKASADGRADGAAAGYEPALGKLYDSLIDALQRAADHASMRQAITEALTECLELPRLLSPEPS
jgi:hypothetical protein